MLMVVRRTGSFCTYLLIATSLIGLVLKGARVQTFLEQLIHATERMIGACFLIIISCLIIEACCLIKSKFIAKPLILEGDKFADQSTTIVPKTKLISGVHHHYCDDTKKPKN